MILLTWNLQCHQLHSLKLIGAGVSSELIDFHAPIVVLSFRICIIIIATFGQKWTSNYPKRTRGHRQVSCIGLKVSPCVLFRNSKSRLTRLRQHYIGFKKRTLVPGGTHLRCVDYRQQTDPLAIGGSADLFWMEIYLFKFYFTERSKSFIRCSIRRPSPLLKRFWSKNFWQKQGSDRTSS